MRFLSRLETTLGLTRGDVTVAMFLAGTAIFGFLWSTFVGQPEGRRDAVELLRLQHLHDSLVGARDTLTAAVDASLDSQDRAPAFISSTSVEDDFNDAADSRDADRAAGRGGKAPPTSPVNVNTAPRSQLLRLPGVGEKTAAAIIELRSHVPFRRPEDLMNVKGIGPKKFEKLRPFIVVR